VRVLVSMTWRGGGGMGLADDRRGECVEASLVKLKVPVASRAPSREARAQAVAPARARERERDRRFRVYEEAPGFRPGLRGASGGSGVSSSASITTQNVTSNEIYWRHVISCRSCSCVDFRNARRPRDSLPHAASHTPSANLPSQCSP